MIEKNKLPRRSALGGTRVALVDGDREFLNTIAALLRAEGMHVDTYRTSTEAYDRFRDKLPDAIVISREMQGLSGMQILETLRRYSDIPILMTSTSEQDLDEAMAFRLGADDYVRKPLRERALVERVRAKLRRSRIAEPAKIHVPPAANRNPIIEYGPIRLDNDRAEITFKGVTISTTKGEYQLLSCLMGNPEIVRSKENLLDLFPPHGRGRSDTLVASHVKRIRAKIRAVDPKADPIATHYGLGYTMNPALAS